MYSVSDLFYPFFSLIRLCKYLQKCIITVVSQISFCKFKNEYSNPTCLSEKVSWGAITVYAVSGTFPKNSLKYFIKTVLHNVPGCTLQCYKNPVAHFKELIKVSVIPSTVHGDSPEKNMAGQWRNDGWEPVFTLT